MTDLATPLSAQPRGDIQSDAIRAEPVQTPAFNTEQQGLIDSAPTPTRPKVRRHQILAPMRAQFGRTRRTNRPTHCPNRYYFNEDAAMSREMDRL